MWILEWHVKPLWATTGLATTEQLTTDRHATTRRRWTLHQFSVKSLKPSDNTLHSLHSILWGFVVVNQNKYLLLTHLYITWVTWANEHQQLVSSTESSTKLIKFSSHLSKWFCMVIWGIHDSRGIPTLISLQHCTIVSSWYKQYSMRRLRSVLNLYANLWPCVLYS